jgi:hypothetical protein
MLISRLPSYTKKTALRLGRKMKEGETTFEYYIETLNGPFGQDYEKKHTPECENSRTSLADFEQCVLAYIDICKSLSGTTFTQAPESRFSFRRHQLVR